MPRGGWANTEYGMREGSSNPRLRPSIDSLITKLRNLSVLRDRPEAVEFVVNDLIYHYLYREQRRPRALFRVMMRVDSLWRLALNAPINEEEEAAVQSAAEARHEALLSGESVLAGPVGEEIAASNDSDSGDRHQEVAVDRRVSSAMERPEGWSPVVNLTDYLKRPEIKEVVEDVLAHHWITWSQRGTKCACHKEFSGIDGWARHVRIRIWRPLIGSVSESKVEEGSTE